MEVYNVEGEIFGELAIDFDGRIVVAGNNSVVSIGAAGEVLWTEMLQKASGNSVTLDNEGCAILITDDRELVKINAEGEELWRVEIGSCFTSIPVVDNEGSIYIVGRNGAVAIDGDGATRWTFEGGLADSSDLCLVGVLPSPIVLRDSSVIVLDIFEMRIAMLDEGGEVVADSYLDGELGMYCLTNASLSTLLDGVLVGRCERMLKNLYIGDIDLQDSWSQFRHDGRNTGNNAL